MHALMRVFHPCPVLACLPACLPADAKVVQFYTKLRQRQLQALGLDPAQFKTIY